MTAFTALHFHRNLRTSHYSLSGGERQQKKSLRTSSMD